MTLLHSGSVIEALSNVGIIKGPEARVFVVDPSDSGFTIQNAIDECIAAKGDVILMLPGASVVTTSVLFNKSGINVLAVNRGLNPLIDGEFHSILSNASYTDGPAATITAPCRIIGMGFVSRDTGSLFFSGAACLLGGDGAQGAPPFGVQMKNCRFPKWGLDNRIGLAIEGSSDCLIEECTFEGVGSALAVGIYVQGATQNLVIRGNHSRQCTAFIQYGAFAGGGPHAIIDRNIIEDGVTLDSQGNTAPSFLTDNYSELADTAAYDSTIGTLDGQGIKFAGNHYKET